jgi:hypothetical protein
MKHYDTMTGYKATDANMQCRGFQYELGRWYRHEGDLKLCSEGFHFCPHPSGPWAFYDAAGTRIFAVEARDVWMEYEPGADVKAVCREIRLVSEVSFDGNRNTGDWNTGNRNTGDWNTGNWNTGYWNTGDWNTSDRNTGNWNTGNRSCGMFCSKEPCVVVFDVQTDMTFQEFLEKYPQCRKLGEALMSDEVFDYALYSSIPGWTLEKCAALHRAFIAARTPAPAAPANTQET